jgi:hypothetical protein
LSFIFPDPEERAYRADNEKDVNLFNRQPNTLAIIITIQYLGKWRIESAVRNTGLGHDVEDFLGAFQLFQHQECSELFASSFGRNRIRVISVNKLFRHTTVRFEAEIDWPASDIEGLPFHKLE